MILYDNKRYENINMMYNNVLNKKIKIILGI